MDVIPNKKKHVSSSQFSKWLKCPHWWALDYVKGLKQFDASVNTCFGTAIHETVQTFIKTLYTDSVEKAELIDLFKLFKDTFERELKNEKIEYTEDEYTEFIFDGEDILKEFSKTANRIKHFPKEKYEFVDIELEVEMPIKHNVDFVAYLDLVLREKKTGDIKILDFKTSSNGWNEHMKDDYTKTSQLILYKAFYSKKFDIPLNKIDVEFFILKRKLYEKVSYPQNRIQLFVPPNNNAIIVETVNDFSQFISKSFTQDGEYIMDMKNFPKNPGDRKKNCSYCKHKKINCDQKQELE